MRIQAYQESYLNNARVTLASLFDYAINDCSYEPNEFSMHFLISGIAKQFSKGNPKYISGKSGVELGIEIMESVWQREFYVCPKIRTYRTKEYWAGWALAYFQWTTSKTFDEIFDRISLKEIIQMYNPYHESDISKFVEYLTAIYFSKETNLRKIRRRNKLTQESLAELSTINLRSIQMYEQRNNDINKSQSVTLFNLSKILNCQMEDLLE